MSASRQMTRVEARYTLAIDASNNMVTARFRLVLATYLFEVLPCTRRDLYQTFLARSTNQLRWSVYEVMQALKSKVPVLINWNLVETFALRHHESPVLQVIIDMTYCVRMMFSEPMFLSFSSIFKMPLQNEDFLDYSK